MKTVLIHIRRNTMHCLELVTGTFLTAAAFGLIIIPQGFSSGGVTGLARLTAASLCLPLPVIVMVYNLTLLALGYFLCGKRFALKTVFSSLVFPVLLDFFSDVAWAAPSGIAGALTAGLLLGSGVGLTIRSGASLGGFDVVAIVLDRRFGIPMGVVLCAIDCTVIALQSIGNPIPETVYGILAIAVSAVLTKPVSMTGVKKQLALS
ncbi:MAG: YitT family protein [Clostridia bacterium]|nr:YitT family protein [Clostridia bacterium]